MAMADVTVRGAGIFGLSVAWACARRGALVQVIDPGGPGAGVSGGVVGALAPHVPENWNAKKAFQLDSLLMAETFWAEIAQVSGLSPGYARTGRLQPLEPGGEALAAARAIEAQTLWQGRALWRVADAADFPHPPLGAGGQVIHDTLSARLHPAQACAALVGALTAKGAVIRAEGQDEGQVIWATGMADLAALNAAHHRQVGSPVKGQAAVMDLALRDHPQIFAGGVHIVPHEDGTTAVGSTAERDFSGLDCDALLEDVIAAARAAFAPLKNASVIRRWAGLRPRSRSRAPMLGAHPLHPGQFIANGGFKIGFGMAPKIGEVMADLLLEERDTIPSEFRPEASL